MVIQGGGDLIRGRAEVFTIEVAETSNDQLVKQRENEDENEGYGEKEALGPGLIAGREEGGQEPVDGDGG